MFGKKPRHLRATLTSMVALTCLGSFLAVSADAATAAPFGQAAPVVARCDPFEGVLCVHVKGSRGQFVMAGVTYDKTSGPNRTGQLCFLEPGKAWKCNAGALFRKGASYSFAVPVTVKAGCYRAGIYTGGKRHQTACLNK